MMFLGGKNINQMGCEASHVTILGIHIYSKKQMDYTKVLRCELEFGLERFVRGRRDENNQVY